MKGGFVKTRKVSDRQMFAAIKKCLRAMKRADKLDEQSARLDEQIARLKQRKKKVKDIIRLEVEKFFGRMIACKLGHGRGAPVVIFSGGKRLKVKLRICKDCKDTGQDASGFMRVFRRDNICQHCFLGSGVTSATITDNGQVIKIPLPNSGLFVKAL